MARRWLDEVRPLLGDRQVDLDAVLSAIVDALAARFEAERATFYLVDHSAGQLVSRAAHLPEIAEIRLPVGEGAAGRVAASGEGLAIAGPGDGGAQGTASARFDALTGFETRSMLVAPVVRPGSRTVIGVLQVLNAAFGPGDLERLQGFAGDFAALLDETSLRVQLRPEHDKPLAFRFNFIVGASAAMHAVYERVDRAAGTEATVLVRGETGTGKTLVARAVHFNSPRRDGPFVKVDCAALPANLVVNELFGHEKGAYTGADQRTDGQVARAAGGTLFLDEIGELPLDVQGKLLRLLQERTYLRVGGTEVQHASVRFVCATHVDLEAAVREGRFRQDLYYRLRVVEIEIPPLRARGHVDLDRLIDHFHHESCRRHGRERLRLSAGARAALHAWRWPGNVRELEHCVESAVVMAPGDEIRAADLPLRELGAGPELGGAGSEGAFATPVASLREVERAYLRHVLSLCEGNKSRAADVLGISRNTLARKLTDDA